MGIEPAFRRTAPITTIATSAPTLILSLDRGRVLWPTGDVTLLYLTKVTNSELLQAFLSLRTTIRVMTEQRPSDHQPVWMHILQAPPHRFILTPYVETDARILRTACLADRIKVRAGQRQQSDVRMTSQLPNDERNK